MLWKNHYVTLSISFNIIIIKKSQHSVKYDILVLKLRQDDLKDK